MTALTTSNSRCAFVIWGWFIRFPVHWLSSVILIAPISYLQPSLGWTGAAMAQGAANCGLSPAAAGLLGDSPGDLVQVFLRHCNLQLEEVLQDDPAVGGMAEKIEHGLRKRLEMILPYKGTAGLKGRCSIQKGGKVLIELCCTSMA